MFSPDGRAKAICDCDYLYEVAENRRGLKFGMPPAAPAASSLSACEHREKLPSYPSWFPIAVARKVSRSEYISVPEAKAVDAEWEKLRKLKRPNPKDQGRGAWAEEVVREEADVREEARVGKFKVHFGGIAELCHENGSELPKGDPNRKYKGRSVFWGNNLKDEAFSWAGFAELGSAPPTLEAANS